MISEHKRQGKGQDRVYFAGYLSSWGTCNLSWGTCTCTVFEHWAAITAGERGRGRYNSAGRARGEGEAAHWTQRFPFPPCFRR